MRLLQNGSWKRKLCLIWQALASRLTAAAMFHPSLPVLMVALSASLDRVGACQQSETSCGKLHVCCYSSDRSRGCLEQKSPVISAATPRAEEGLSASGLHGPEGRRQAASRKICSRLLMVSHSYTATPLHAGSVMSPRRLAVAT